MVTPTQDSSYGLVRAVPKTLRSRLRDFFEMNGADGNRPGKHGFTSVNKSYMVGRRAVSMGGQRSMRFTRDTRNQPNSRDDPILIRRHYAGSNIRATSGMAASSSSNVERDIWEPYGTRKVEQQEPSPSRIGLLLPQSKDRPRRSRSHSAFPTPSTRTRQAPPKGRTQTWNVFTVMLRTGRWPWSSPRRKPRRSSGADNGCRRPGTSPHAPADDSWGSVDSIFLARSLTDRNGIPSVR
jgi:hypothetical protein